MTVETAASAAYIVAALLFILALAGLSHHETAKAGNSFGMAGMVVALAATAQSGKTSRTTSGRSSPFRCAWRAARTRTTWRCAAKSSFRLPASRR